MTVSRFRTTIRCDHPGGCDAWWGVGVGETDEQVRARIARWGWQSFAIGEAMQDICTMHGREVSGR